MQNTHPARYGGRDQGRLRALEGTGRSAAVQDVGRHDMHLHARVRGDR
ncbi:hypothetical protein ACGFOW_01360 [Streptomyces rubiginosohelvolus]